MVNERVQDKLIEGCESQDIIVIRDFSRGRGFCPVFDYDFRLIRRWSPTDRRSSADAILK
jgi:hypothetical protein